MHIAYASEHPSRSCIHLCMRYCTTPSVISGSITYRNGCDAIFSSGDFESMMFGRARLMYEQMR